MGDPKQEIVEAIQRMVVRLLATTRSGVGLALIGGFRYRLLDRGPRVSKGIDYHWGGELVDKRDELIAVFNRRLLPEVFRKFRYAGSAKPHCGPEGESPVVAVIQLAFWRDRQAYSRMEIPVDIVRISCLDDLTVKIIDGVAYPTLSDQDMIENKVIAVLARNFLQHRDLLDTFLFANNLAFDSPERIDRKLAQIGVGVSRAADRLDALTAGRDRHIRAIDDLIANQVDPDVAANLRLGGGAAMVFDSAAATASRQAAVFLGDRP